MPDHLQSCLRVALLLCVLLCLQTPHRSLGAAAEEVYPQIEPTDARDAAAPLFCVVVRTYWGHGRASRSGLKQLIASLQRQTVQAWEALLVVMDSRPFADLPQLLRGFRDDRVWVYAELIDKDYTPRTGGEWAEGYHGRLYNLTDDAIRACPASAQWVVVTNGDNEYASTFLQRVLQVPHADAVAFDFHSRYQRATGPPCARFAAKPGAPPCKQNKLQWCHTDLGANALKLGRLLAEDRRFGVGPDSEVAGDHLDGVFAQGVHAAGWRVHHVHRSCLFDHSPSPQRCARLGGTWDDSRAAAEEKGGTCLTPQARALGRRWPTPACRQWRA